MADRRFTDLELERQLAGDLPAARAFATEATAADKARMTEIEQEHAAFLGGIDIDNEVRRIQQRAAASPQGERDDRRAVPEKRSWLRWLMPTSAMVAAAAAVIIYVSTRKTTPGSGDDPDIIYKGDGVSLVIYVKAGDASQRLQSGDTIASGAKIRFEIQNVQQGYIAVVGIDGSGQTSVYYPKGNDAAQLDDHLLHVAIQLDATPGDETFFAVYSKQPFAIDAALPGVRGIAALPAGVTTSKVVLHKLVNK